MVTGDNTSEATMNGKEFRAWRVSQGLTQQQVADMFGYRCKSYISMIESDTKKVTKRIEAMVNMATQLRGTES